MESADPGEQSAFESATAQNASRVIAVDSFASQCESLLLHIWACPMMCDVGCGCSEPTNRCHLHVWKPLAPARTLASLRTVMSLLSRVMVSRYIVRRHAACSGV